MKKCIIIPVLITLTSCFSSFDQEVEYRIDPRVSEYVNEFFSEAEKRGIVLYKHNLIVVVAHRYEYIKDPIINSKAGYAWKEGDQRIIWIDEDTFNHLSNAHITHKTTCRTTWLKLLVFHELGHSLLNREHNKQHSIMNDAIDSEKNYNHENCEIYSNILDELFLTQ